MVHLGLADGMVSGAAHTTAHTIKPSFEIIKTAPDAKIVSSVFLMALADRVLVYGDCAVNPDPSAEELADIAISSARTAEAFGVDPRVAMLSYSTGTSGSGADVEKVRSATELVRERAPKLLVDGPI
ncbi:phosphate acetyltransferase, partial [Bradyrhizobium sp. BRP14]|nr:phosphate acetyltransferase [Bradyrhizobium sp. BRP14]